MNKKELEEIWIKDTWDCFAYSLLFKHIEKNILLLFKMETKNWVLDYKIEDFSKAKFEEILKNHELEESKDNY